MFGLLGNAPGKRGPGGMGRGGGIGLLGAMALGRFAMGGPARQGTNNIATM